MIERIATHVQGELGKDSINDIKDHIVNMIEINYEKIFDADCNPGKASDASHFAAYLMFGQEHFLCINSKNIEFQDSFYYDGFRPICDHMAKMLKKGWVKDFLVHIVVYRLGQYSYFAAEVTPLVEENILKEE